MIENTMRSNAVEIRKPWAYQTAGKNPPSTQNSSYDDNYKYHSQYEQQTAGL